MFKEEYNLPEAEFGADAKDLYTHRYLDVFNYGPRPAIEGSRSLSENKLGALISIYHKLSETLLRKRVESGT